MPLQPGTSLGPYEIESPLGAGGMGEVYKARDSRLDRTVAIKVLPEHVATDPELKQRFEREAKTVAALSHPHICPVFDVGEQGGVNFLVMEYLEGETLAQRIQKGALPPDRALTIAIEIADALDKAHRQGIVHRDLKPGNIMLTKSGAKLLDFGLAKLRKPAVVGAEGYSAATTQSVALTAQGTVMGTLPYMAPEQVEGKEADARTDIFSFGAIIYEMLTGRRPFQGESQASLIAEIIQVEPPAVSTLQPATPPGVDRFITTCLSKDRDERWQTATDLKRELQWMHDHPRQPDSLAPVAERSQRRRTVGWRAIAVVSVLLVGLVLWQMIPRDSSSDVVTRTTIELPANQQLDFRGASDPLAISPDGERLVYAASADGRLQLYVRELDAFNARPIAGTDGARYPFFSPDGEEVAFIADGVLQRVPVAGGAAVPICDVPTIGRAGTWGSDDTIVFAGDSGLLRVDAAGGTPTPITSGNAEIDRLTHRYPRFLPDGRGIVSTVRFLPGFEPETVAVLDLESRDWHVVGPGVQGQYLPSGHLIFHAGSGEEGELHAVPFDIDEMTVTGARVSVLEGMFRGRNGGAAYYVVSDNGTLAFAPGGQAHTLVRVDRLGRRTPLFEERLGFRFPRLSPDGTRLAVTIDPRPSEIWVYDLGRGSRVSLSTDAHSLGPVWSLDGRRVAYRHGSEIYWRAADGTTPAERLIDLDSIGSPETWSPDGQWMVFIVQGLNQAWDIWGQFGGGPLEPLVATVANELNARLSPDGGWMAYNSDESGRSEVYVQPFPNVTAGRWTVSTGGGHTPVWSPDGTELFYINGTELLAVSVETRGEAFTAAVPEVLFDGPFATTQDGNFDVFPDGGHFLMVEADPDAEPSRFRVVINWFEELNARVPTP